MRINQSSRWRCDVCAKVVDEYNDIHMPQGWKIFSLRIGHGTLEGGMCEECVIEYWVKENPIKRMLKRWVKK